VEYQLVLGLYAALLCGVATFTYLHSRKQRELRSKSWLELSQRLHLRAHVEGGWMSQTISSESYALSGRVASRQVHLTFQDQSEDQHPDLGSRDPQAALGEVCWGRTAARVDVGVDLPDGLEIGHETAGSEALRYLGAEDAKVGHPSLDAVLRVACDDEPGLQALFAHPTVQSAFRDHFCPWPGSSLCGQTLELARSGESPEVAERLLQSALALAAALEAAVAEALQAAVASRGLVLGHAPVGGRWFATGSVEGLAVQVSASGRDTEVRVALPLHAPLGLVVLTAPSSELMVGDPVRLQNPMLSRFLHVWAYDAEAAAEAFVDDLTEPLLSLLKGHPGTRLADGELFVPMPACPSNEELGEVIDDAVALACGLGALRSGPS
jgi:hypothetical protein